MNVQHKEVVEVDGVSLRSSREGLYPTKGRERSLSAVALVVAGSLD